ncbi:hypothetical protein IBK40_28900, partial [Escherichia coli]|nr:hypothetical protein [Escherichia coli]
MNTTGSDTEFNGAVTTWKTDLQRHMFGAMFQRIQYWTVELDNELSPINADRELLKQVLLNILINAVQAISARGKIRIQTW